MSRTLFFILLFLFFCSNVMAQSEQLTKDYIKEKIVTNPGSKYYENKVYWADELMLQDLPYLFGITAPISEADAKSVIIVSQWFIHTSGIGKLTNYAFDVRGISNVLVNKRDNFAYLKIFIKDGYFVKTTTKGLNEDNPLYKEVTPNNNCFEIGFSEDITSTILGEALLHIGKLKAEGLPESTITTTINLVKSESGIYEIPVEINGVLKINFIFDSGASDVSISPDVALTLIRTGTIREDDFIGTQKYRFADGSIATSRVFMIHEIKLGDRVLKNITASIASSLDAPMLLGQSVLQKFAKFSIDNNSHILVIE